MAPSPSPDAAAPKPVRNILVLDDDPTIRMLVGKVVERIGATPYAAATTAEAHALAGTTRFACALIDKNLGKEDGIEFLRWLRTTQPDCDPVVMTAYGNVESTIEALRLGASDFLQKPFELDVITHRLRLLLERQQLIAESQAMRAQIVQADRLSTLGTLAAGVVHEINNPLTYVRAGLDFLPDCVEALRAATRGRVPELEPMLAEIEDVVDKVSHGANQMAGVVSHIRSFAHHTVEVPARVDLAFMLEGTLGMSTVLIRQRARLVRDFGPAPDVEAIESQLAQVFLNLIVNAVQAIPEGAANDHAVKVGLHTGPGGEAVIEVSDTGTGMPPEIVSRLFEPFFTTKPRGVGTGIGLTICRNIITALSGRIEVESAVGKGTTFRVTLPPIASEALVAPPLTADLPLGRRGRLLIIDDEEAITTILGRLFSRDHDVTTENSGRGALTRLEAGERFDVILCDLMMPEVTGPQFYAEVERAHASHAPRVLFVTAGVLSPAANEFAIRVGERLIPKPFDIPMLRRRIATLIRDLPQR